MHQTANEHYLQFLVETKSNTCREFAYKCVITDKTSLYSIRKIQFFVWDELKVTWIKSVNHGMYAREDPLPRLVCL